MKNIMGKIILKLQKALKSLGDVIYLEGHLELLKILSEKPC